MIRYLANLIALFAVLTGSFAQAQTVQDGFVRPPDVPAYVEQYGGYQNGTDANELGDGEGDGATSSNARGGTMPVIATMLADIPTDSAIAATWKGAATAFLDIPPATQPKLRMLGSFSHINRDDAIRNFGAPGTAHAHCYFGNRTVNAYSTYASLRTRANTYALGAPKKSASSVAGGPLNGTGYWAPCFTKTVSGKTYAIKYNTIVIYYEESTGASSALLSRLPRGLRYITGRNADDPLGASVLAEIAAANAQSGTSGRYSRGVVHGTLNDGFTGYECRTSASVLVLPAVAHRNAAGNAADYIKATDGSDPWAGACTTGMKITAHLNAPTCYDGTNLWSPGGYRHFRFPVGDNAQAGDSCPDGWFRMPKLNITLEFYHKGFADYGTWTLSSDQMFEDKLTALGTPTDLPTGWSMHTDWFGGWDDTVMYGNSGLTIMGWLPFCLGVDGNTPHECNSSQFNATQYLKGGYTGENAPDLTRTPQTDTDGTWANTDDPTKMVQVPSSPGSLTIHSGVN